MAQPKQVPPARNAVDPKNDQNYDPKQNAFYVRALENYAAETEDELSFHRNALLFVVETYPNGWWFAIDEHARDGWIPSTFVHRCVADEQRVFEANNKYAMRFENKQARARSETCSSMISAGSTGTEDIVFVGSNYEKYAPKFNSYFKEPSTLPMLSRETSSNMPASDDDTAVEEIEEWPEEKSAEYTRANQIRLTVLSESTGYGTDYQQALNNVTMRDLNLKPIKNNGKHIRGELDDEEKESLRNAFNIVLGSQKAKGKASESIDKALAINGGLHDLSESRHSQHHQVLAPPDAKWPCPVCTFENPSLKTKCELCLTPKPSKTLKSPQAVILPCDHKQHIPKQPMHISVDNLDHDALHRIYDDRLMAALNDNGIDAHWCSDTCTTESVLCQADAQNFKGFILKVHRRWIPIKAVGTYLFILMPEFTKQFRDRGDARQFINEARSRPHFAKLMVCSANRKPAKV